MSQIVTLDIPSPGDVVGDLVGGAASSVAGSAIDKFAQAVSEAVGESVKSVSTIWTKVPTVGLGTGETASTLQNNLFWFVGFAAVLSVIIAGGRMAWEGRSQPLRELAQSLFTLVLVTGGGLALVRLAVVAGDEFSMWLIGGSGGEDFNTRMTALIAAVTTAGGPLGVMLVILVGLVLILASMAQIILMIARSGMLVLLAGVLPLAGAATNTEWGKQWFQKTSGWMIAFILYKPAAALVYAAAFELFGDSKDLLGALTGMTMMILAVAALPALMKLTVPLVGSLAGGAGGGAAGAMAGGAMMSSSMGGGGGPTGAVSQPSQSPASMGTPGSSGGSGPAGAAPSGGGSSAAGAGSGAGTAAGSSGAAASSGGGAAASGSAAGAGAAAGPVGAGVAVASEAMSKGKQAANDAVDGGGPDGSN